MARARRRKERKKTMKLPQELAELASTVPVYIDPAGSLRAALPAALTASQASGWRQLYPTDARRIRARAQLKAGLDRDAREYRARLIAELASAPDRRRGRIESNVGRSRSRPRSRAGRWRRHRRCARRETSPISSGPVSQAGPTHQEVGNE